MLPRPKRSRPKGLSWKSKVVAPHVAVFFLALVEPGDGFAGLDEPGEHLGKPGAEILLVGHFQGLDALVQAFARHDVQDAHRVSRRVRDGDALHEAGVAAHEVEDARFLARTARAGDDHGADGHGKAFVEHELEELALAGFQLAAAFDPEFGVFQAEAAFGLVAQDQEVAPGQGNDVARADAHEFGGVGVDFSGMPRGEIRGHGGQERSGGWGQGGLACCLICPQYATISPGRQWCAQ